MSRTPKRGGRSGMPLLTALAAQFVAGALVFGTTYVLGSAPGLALPLAALLALQGVGAALLGWGFGLAKWWLPIQLVAPSAVAVALSWRLPGWLSLAAFLGLVLVFSNSLRGGVPLYLTNRKTKEALAGLLPKEGGFKLLDLGSGLGGPVTELARRRPDGHFTGVESAPLLFALSWLRRRLVPRSNTDIRFGDFWSLDLAPYDVVYCFLSPVPMPALFEKARAEMRPGSLLISNTFTVPEHPADETVDVGDRRRSRLYLWRM
ncbi:MAG: class I SAM-dependent methyltransferase [Proteobacteria bacterium]|nr:class I SAM-dependent methyltransferase [Pseudomonadota bacterium]